MVRPGDVIQGGAADRIERQLADLTDAVQRLVLLEERQTRHHERMDVIEQRLQRHSDELAKQRENLSRWINRGLGLWSAALVMWAIANSPLARAITG